MESDRMLRIHIEDELTWEPSLDHSAIAVSAKNGIITLSGSVPSFVQKYTAEKAALRVKAVAGLANELVVSVPVQHGLSDAEIADACVTSLVLDSSVPKSSVKVVVRDGSVTLEGEVEWQFQRKAAGHAVRDLQGVINVFNMIKVKPKVMAADVEKQIAAAFRRSADVDAGQVTAEVSGSTVILEGTVSSWTERSAAERVAWAAPGVTEVKNRLAVETATGVL